MKPFLRRASYLDKFNVLHNLNEYIREYIVKYGDYVITAYVDCPQELKSGLIRISLNAGLNIDGFVNAYDNLSDTQVRMLKHNLPNFLGWFINSKYEKDVNYVHYARTTSKDKNCVIWPICNIIELESEESIVQGILDLAYMAAITIVEIHKSCIPFADSQHILDTEISPRLNIVEDFLKFCKR